MHAQSPFAQPAPSRAAPQQHAHAFSSARPPPPALHSSRHGPHPPHPHRSTFYSDLLLFDTATSKWKQLFSSIPNFKPRANHAAVLIGAEVDDPHVGTSGRQAPTHGQGQLGVEAQGKVKGQLWVIGGSDNEGVFTEAHVLDLATHTWHRPTIRCVPQRVGLSHWTVTENCRGRTAHERK